MLIENNAITIAKLLLDINNDFEDDLFVALGTIVEKEAELYTKNVAILYEEELLAQMIAYKYRNRGNENISSQSMATISETYITGYPEVITIALNGFRKLKAL